MLYGIHTYGLAAVGAMLALYASIKLGDAPTVVGIALVCGLCRLPRFGPPIS